jgi:hypothetical protein
VGAVPRESCRERIKQTGLAGGDAAMADDERAIQDVVDTWMSASKAGDVQTVLSLMTDDATSW